jgi:hypothetical protein
MVHHAHADMDALANYGAGRDRAIEVEELDPVVVDNASLLRVGFGGRRSARAIASA